MLDPISPSSHLVVFTGAEAEQKIRITALKLYAIPLFLLFVLLFLGAIASGFDNYHDHTMHWWDILRLTAIVVSIGTSSIAAAYLALWLCRKWLFKRLIFISLFVGTIWSFLTTLLIFSSWYFVEHQLYVRLVKPIASTTGFSFGPTNSLPSGPPDFTFAGILWGFVACNAFCLPISVCICFYLRKRWNRLSGPNQSFYPDAASTS